MESSPRYYVQKNNLSVPANSVLTCRVAQSLGGSPAFKEIFQFGHAGLKFIDIISFYPTYQHPVLPYTVDSVFQALYEFRQCFCLFYVRQQFITITGAIAVLITR